MLSLATGGSANHMLALDYALRPVLQSLAPRLVLQGIYAIDAQVTLLTNGAHTLTSDIGVRVDEAVDMLFAEGLRASKQPVLSVVNPIESVHLSQVRCSA